METDNEKDGFLPKVKRDLSVFLSSEEGKILKKDVVEAAAVLGILGAGLLHADTALADTVKTHSNSLHNSFNNGAGDKVMIGSHMNLWTTVETAPASQQTSCTPPAAETRTQNCPSGQTGSITETRTWTCTSATGTPVVGNWTQTSNTCHATCAAAATACSCPNASTGGGGTLCETSACCSGICAWTGGWPMRYACR
ncbi:MAG: hypothetical protein PHP45_03660 [Elusimicrobiales bacterium]|nr:hypothetical protein [Elusimicrobiales bacterium]